MKWNFLLLFLIIYRNYENIVFSYKIITGKLEINGDSQATKSCILKVGTHIKKQY